MGIEIISGVFGLIIGLGSTWVSSIVFAVRLSNAFNTRLESLEDRFDKQFNILHEQLTRQSQNSAVYKTSVDARFELIELKIATLSERIVRSERDV